MPLLGPCDTLPCGSLPCLPFRRGALQGQCLSLTLCLLSHPVSVSISMPETGCSPRSISDTFIVTTSFPVSATHVESIIQLTHLTDEATEAGSGAAGRGRICTRPQSRKELAQGHGQSWELSTGRVAPL